MFTKKVYIIFAYISNKTENRFMRRNLITFWRKRYIPEGNKKYKTDIVVCFVAEIDVTLIPMSEDDVRFQVKPGFALQIFKTTS